ncbi:MAG: hypothetical protein ACREQA_09795 [Candidatus Binatia bacterium]
MRQLAKAAVTFFSVIVLLSVLGLGFMTSWGRVDPNLHVALAFLAAVVAVGIHVQGGSGLDFLAAVLLVVAMALGFMVLSGGMSSASHLWVAMIAVGVSAGTQIRNLLRGMK